MPIATKKLIQLLHPDRAAEVRRAAALVIGELGARDAELGRALCERLDDEDAGVRLQAIQAVGQLRVDGALPLLLARIKDGGAEAELASRAVAQLGARGTRALHDLMPKVSPGVRRYLAAALAGGSGAGAEAIAVLLDGDPGVVDAAARSLAGQVPNLTAAQRRGLTDHLLDLLGDGSAPLQPASEGATVRLLVALDDPRAEAALWDRTLAPHPPGVRAAALQALGKWSTAPGKDQLHRLFACAADPDFRVAAPALLILKNLPVDRRALPEWLTLLHAPDVAVRLVALEKVGDRDTNDVAAALVEQLAHPDRTLRESALTRLSQLKSGRAALAAELIGAESADRAWALAKGLAPFIRDYPAAWRDEVFAQICDRLEASDRRADALLFLLREADAADLHQRLEERAAALRKKKDYSTALLYLRLLTRDPACGFPTRLEQAACALKVSNHDPADAHADPALQQFDHLAHHFESELADAVEKIKWLDPDDLYYLGFHLAEQEGPAKRLAAKVLHLVLKRSPRSKLAQAARSKLRSAGLD